MNPGDRVKIRGLVRRARYGHAFRLSRRLLKKYPKDIHAKYHYAVLLSDNCYGISKALLKKRRLVTVKMLKELLKVDIKDADLSRSIKNELYWFSEQPQKQWLLGADEVKSGSWPGYYSMGVGAAMRSYSYHLVGKKGAAVSWARKSEAAWKQYFKKQPSYYNAWAFYARCLGFQMRIKEMERALKKAAKLSRRSTGYPEFQLVRKQVREALRTP